MQRGETKTVVQLTKAHHKVIMFMKTPQHLGLSHGSILRCTLGFALLGALAQLRAQNQVFSEDFEIDHSLDGTYVTNETAGCTNYVNLYFDYSTAGIPLAPNSPTSSTRGLKMAANVGSGVFGGVSVTPIAFDITDNFDMRFDAWFNFNGPLPGGGSGSTQVGGAGYGTAGTSAQTAGAADSVFIGGTGDGGSSADYRVYSSWHPISYQDGSFRIGSDGTNATTLGDPSSGYVYARTNRNALPGYGDLFPGQQCPAAQLALYPQQTNSNGSLPGEPGFANNGTLAFKWHDISLKKLGNVITYTIDGFLIATVDITDAGPLGGSKIHFNCYDINASSSTDPNFTNLNFTLIDNVRITNYANVITVFSTNAPVTAEAASPIPGVFTIVRPDTAVGNPVTVLYTLTGSAENGVDYTNLSGSVVIAAGETTTNIYIQPIDDTEPEFTETVVLDIAESPDYIGGGSATVAILDNEPGQLSIQSLSTQVYERTNDFALFQISRLGATNTASFDVNLTFSGTASAGTDFYVANTVSFEEGVASTNFTVLPIEDGLFEGNETIQVNLAPAGGGEYTIGSSSNAVVTLVDADNPPETVLYSEDFDTDNSANWNIYFATTNGAAEDGYTQFAFDYSSLSLPAAPHGAGTLGLIMSVNKGDGTPVAAAFNAYPKLQNFSGNYALRFDMSLNSSAGGSATEYALCGLNHSGNQTNWWRSGGVPAGWNFDGVFAAVETDGGSTPHYAFYSSPNAANNPTLLVGTNKTIFVDQFKSPPFAIAGAPTVNRTNAVPGPAWADVEMSKIGSLITLKINKTTILQYTNTTGYNSGNIMLGYLDAFDSIGDANGNFVVYDNLRVIGLTAPTITDLDLTGSPKITFSAGASDVVAQFTLQSAGSVQGPFVTDAAAVVSQQSPGVFTATSSTPYNPAENPKFYRIARIY